MVVCIVLPCHAIEPIKLERSMYITLQLLLNKCFPDLNEQGISCIKKISAAPFEAMRSLSMVFSLIPGPRHLRYHFRHYESSEFTVLD
ncbi:hypothetical protein SESBI_13444 [Sesbania bispinosa]|nr:hypothetical protein SESBI_13444 [Sesbania bispinosa]